LTSRSRPATGERSALEDVSEHEAATRDILQIIAHSRDDETPALNAIARTALRLCGSELAAIWIVNGDSFALGAHTTTDPDLARFFTEHPVPTGRASVAGRALLERQAIHVDDLAADPELGQLPQVLQSGTRSLLAVPLILSDGTACGVITVSNRQLKPFTPDQIMLVETFAAQAVIAIENVRQFRALQERTEELDQSNWQLRARLEHEEATREILQAISRSREDDTAVFDVILKNATRLCKAPLAYLRIVNASRTSLEIVAHYGAHAKFVEESRRAPLPLDIEQSDMARTVIEKRVVHIEDIADSDLYRNRQQNRVFAVETEGIRTVLGVPLLGGAESLGAIVLYRREVAPFTHDEIALVETFAAQAVIAIENVRQFRELQTRLAREAATRHILQVISQSRDDEKPVFDVILENAARLCQAPMARLHLVDDDRMSFRSVAFWGDPMRSMVVGESWPLDAANPLARAMIEGQTLRLADHADTEWYRSGDPVAVRLVEVEGVRTRLSVPLMRGDMAIGAITLSRREVKPFTEDQIALVESFAAQAVIAIENVRQFKALEARTAEVQSLNEGLEARVEEQVGEIERMGRLKRFMPAAVADAVVLAGDDRLLSSHRALIAVLFCDIRGFTAFCETAEPEETIEVLQTYHEEMGKLIAEHGAGVDHRMGDGIMVLFNDPLPCEDPAGNALRLALAMRTRMAELCYSWKRLGHRLGFGMGISLGYATVGMVGSEGRYEYTASGTAVNLAARLCDEAEDGDILLSPRACAAVEGHCAAESLGERSFKGIHAPVEIFRVVSSQAKDG